MKTVKQKHVTFNKQEADATFENLANTGSIISAVGSLFTPYASLACSLPTIALPSIYLQNRNVTYKEIQVPMTPEEELAAMTPLEKAHFQIQQALDKWITVRQEQQQVVQTLTQELASCEKDLQTLEQETCPTGMDFTVFQSRLKMRLKSKEGSVQHQKSLLETAQKVYGVLEAEIQKREQTLFDAQEKLNMMQRQKAVIGLHTQLEKIKGESEKNTLVSDRKETEQLALEMEKQQVEIEALMTSIQTEIDVEAVLKTVDSQKVQQ
jgi:hypothetical protein